MATIANYGDAAGRNNGVIWYMTRRATVVASYAFQVCNGSHVCKAIAKSNSLEIERY